jgi:hypothetical protein
MVHFRLGDEGAPALVTVDPLFGFEPVKSLAHCPPRHTETLAQLALGWHACAGRQLADERDERVANGLVLSLPRLVRQL